MVLAFDELIRHPTLERTRPVESVQSDQVAEAFGLKIPQQVLHARALKLKDSVRVPGFEDLERFLIIQRDILQVYLLAGFFRHEFHRVFDDSEVAQAEEVHLEQPDFLDILHRELSGDFPPD